MSTQNNSESPIALATSRCGKVIDAQGNCTGTPWYLSERKIAIKGYNGQYSGFHVAIMSNSNSDDRRIADAKRICAAVNACAGISTEALDQGVIERMAVVLGDIVRLWDPDCDEGEAAQAEALSILHLLKRGEAS